MRTKFAKTDVRYWEQKVAFQTPASRTYSVQIQHANQRAWIGLATANKTQAAFEARKIYLELKANGWQETIARRRKPDAPKRIGTTISDYVDAVRNNTALFPKTIESYNQALRRIAADVHKLASARKAHGVKLSTLTSEKIEAWRIDFVRRKSVNPLAEKSARVSANSFIMRARALFSKDVVARIKGFVEVPEPLPFAGVKAEGVRAPRYRSTFDIVQLLESACAELADAHPEQFKIFLLAAMAGLRRHEIDLLPWSAFRFDESVIRIEATEFFRPKSESSEGDVLVDPELMEVFRGYHARATGEFVIESDGEPNPGALCDHYRCSDHFHELIKWLRAHGLRSARKPLHTLRKEFGSQINARYGLTAAQEQLRHANVAVTASHYIENKTPRVLGFGHLLKSEARTVMALVGHDSKAMSAHYTHVGKEALAKAARSLPEI